MARFLTAEQAPAPTLRIKKRQLGIALNLRVIKALREEGLLGSGNRGKSELSLGEIVEAYLVDLLKQRGKEVEYLDEEQWGWVAWDGFTSHEPLLWWEFRKLLADGKIRQDKDGYWVETEPLHYRSVATMPPASRDDEGAGQLAGGNA